MKIKRGKFYINSDGRCYWITEEFVPDKTKKQTKRDLSERRVTGYFRELADCYKDFVNTQIGSSEARTMTKLMEDIEKVKSDIIELCGNNVNGAEDIS